MDKLRAMCNLCNVSDPQKLHDRWELVTDMLPYIPMKAKELCDLLDRNLCVRCIRINWLVSKYFKDCKDGRDKLRLITWLERIFQLKHMCSQKNALVINPITSLQLNLLDSKVIEGFITLSGIFPTTTLNGKAMNEYYDTQFFKTGMQMYILCNADKNTKITSISEAYEFYKKLRYKVMYHKGICARDKKIHAKVISRILNAIDKGLIEKKYWPKLS